MLEFVGPAARGIYAATTDVTRAELELTPAAERFLDGFGEAGSGGPILESAQATEASSSARSLAPTGRASRCSSSSRRAA